MMVRWMRWHCPTDTGSESWALTVRSRGRYLSVTEVPHNIESLQVSGVEISCFFETWRPEWGSNPRSPTFQAGINNYTRALALSQHETPSCLNAALEMPPSTATCSGIAQALFTLSMWAYTNLIQFMYEHSKCQCQSTFNNGCRFASSKYPGEKKCAFLVLFLTMVISRLNNLRMWRRVQCDIGARTSHR